jgi:hypothetical protein
LKRKSIKIILVVAMSLAISMFTAYIYCYTVASADFLSPNLNIETFDQEFLFSAYESEWKVFESSSFLNGFQLATYLFRQSFYLFSQVPSLDQETLILRC